ncbi:heparinase II/III family protein [Mariniflexile ostreae]|uniref:Heparinase II/III family protein n=1 Tax=Mariniflexile ostreae TaxID=1520892 RepID=A0ABV5FD21_9FLAO
MNKTHTWVLSACLMLVFLGASVKAQELENPMSVQYLKSYLKKQSPRLVLNDKIEKNLKQKINTNPLIQNVYAAIKLNAERVFEKPIINLDIPMEDRSQDNQLDISRDMLNRINMLAMVYRVEKDRSILNRINEEVIAACNFPSWNPKHFLDVSEMALAVSIALDWTAGDLPESTIVLAKKALVEKGLKPSWPENGEQPHWVSSHSNWNQVCHTGMVAAAIVIAEVEPELAAKTIKRALNSMVLALDSYGPDGVYPEGATYWRYGTSFSVTTAAMFESAFETDFGMFNYPGFKESAVFRKLCNAPSGLLYNYGDCGDRTDENGDVTLAWFASKTGNKSFFETEKFMQTPEDMNSLSNLAGVSLVWMAQYEEKGALALPTEWKGDGPNPVVFFTGGPEDSNKYYFGAKGGKGKVGHGNLDAGSFVFELFGERWSVEIGKIHHYGDIERTGFKLWEFCQDCDRWKLLNNNNFGHSTLSVNNQLHVVDGKSTIIDFKPGERPETTLDMSPTFKGQLKNATRRFIKDSPQSLVIEDTVELLEDTELITWQLITQADVTLVKGGAILRQGGKRVTLEILSHPEFTPSVMSLDPPIFYLDKKKEGLKRLEIRFPSHLITDDELFIKVSISG